MKIKRLFIVCHLLIFLLFSVAVVKPTFFYWVLLSSNLILVFISYRIIALRSDKSFLRYLILPVFFINSCFFYSSLLVSKLFIFLILFSAVLLLYYYYKSALKYYFIESDRKKNLPFWSNLFGFLTVFLGSSFIYGLSYFIKINNLILTLLLLVILFLSFFQNIFIERYSGRANLFFSFLFLFSLAPLSWSIFLLPFNYNVSGLIISLIYYSALSFVIFYFKKELTVKKIKYNLLFVGFVLLVTLISVKWR
ncbi:hypothetical protein CVU82_00685 [Candidatus Falkowbacteria bacterium HGW-Falkowbacteria-1]|jgi:hypothetical protein|uniref:Uncharacterized protein n=1 Tax=Candidatus Falkowbacteria bacterium HGW-Falkowbacteria-1 TaxID=2013768 RepID=A0A2N2EAJ1_9BACT|nr:MAG: hypothetical protein CVU82_00685 [Candidatus Falkowbacteria bacterium HGW-Falkowbacteria-1]